jgi:hypothetical protein
VFGSLKKDYSYMLFRMIAFFRGPQSFYLIAAIITFISFVIISLVGFYCYRSYKITKTKSYLMYAISFVILGLGFIAQCITNYKVYLLGSIGRTLLEWNIGYWAYMIMATIAYTLVLNLYLKKKSLFYLSLASIAVLYGVYHFNQVILFQIFSILLLAWVIIKQIRIYSKHNSINALKTIIAFFLIALQHLFLVISGFERT